MNTYGTGLSKAGLEQDSPTRNHQFLPLRLFNYVVGLQMGLIKLPWQAFLYAVSCFTAMLVRFLHSAGSTPPAFRDKFKLQETLKVVEHLQQREDGFRNKLKARAEKGSAPVARTESGELSVVGPAAAPSRLLLLHLMFWVVGGLPAYWLLQQHTVHSISRKFIWTVAAPGSLLYLFKVAGSGFPGTHRIINVCSIFISGFVFCHWLLAH